MKTNSHTSSILVRLAILFAALLSSLGTSRALSIEDWDVSGGTFKLLDTVSITAVAQGPNTAPLPYRIVAEGSDIYGNPTTILIAEGTINILKGQGENQDPERQNLSINWQIPNDGTLHSEINWRISLYTGPVTPSSLGALQRRSSDVRIQVTPNLTIPDIVWNSNDPQSDPDAEAIGGVLYPPGEFYGGDILQFRTTIRNGDMDNDFRIFSENPRQTRPMRPAEVDAYRLRTVLTLDPRWQGTRSADDFLINEEQVIGDMAQEAQPLTTLRAVRAFGTPGALPGYGVAIAAAGTTATAEAQLTGNAVSGVVPTNPGSGYLTPPQVVVSGGETIRATATATLTGTGNVDTVALLNPGRGYTTIPIVTISGGGGIGAAAQAVLNGDRIERIEVTGGGTGYTSVPTVTIVAPPVTVQATIEVSGVADGEIEDDDYTIVDGGSNYASTPTITVAPPQPAAAVAAATVDADGRISAVTPTSGGAGYLDSPAPLVTVTPQPGTSGTGAVIQAVVSNNVIASYKVLSPGGGYNPLNPPAVTVEAPGFGRRNYLPQPDNGYLDIGEEIELDYEVLMPQNYSGVYFVGVRVDATSRIAEPVGDVSPRGTKETPPLDPAGENGNDNTFISDIATRITLLPAPEPTTLIASQVTDTAGNGLLQSNGSSDTGAMSDDGLYVVFSSTATDLLVPQQDAASAVSTIDVGTNVPLLAQVPADRKREFIDPHLTNGKPQIFRRNLSTKAIELMSVASNGAQANDDCFSPTMTPDGRYVVFSSRASNLVPNDSAGSSDIFVRSLNLLRTERVSVNSDGIQGSAGSVQPSISEDGRFVAFASTALNLAGPRPQDLLPAGTRQQVYVHDRETGITRLVSVDAAGNPANNTCDQPRISLDGEWVVFVSTATNLPAGVDGQRGVVYRMALNGGAPAESPDRLVAVSVNNNGQLAEFQGAPIRSLDPVVNEDGTQIAFVSQADNLVPNDSNLVLDVFVRDFTTDPTGPVTKRVSESLNRVSFGTISFNNLAGLSSGLPPVNTPTIDDSVTLSALDGDGNLQTETLTFKIVPAPGNLNQVAIGDNGSMARDNLVAAIDALREAGRLNMYAFPTTPASINEFYAPTSPLPGTANTPGLGVIALTPGVDGNRQILVSGTATGTATVADGGVTSIPVGSPGANYPAPPSVLIRGGGGVGATATAVLTADKVTAFIITNQGSGYTSAPQVIIAPPPGQVLSAFGMIYGGTQAEVDAGYFDGVPFGSDQPSMSRDGRVIAFRSTSQTLDVFERTFAGIFEGGLWESDGIGRGQIIRPLLNGFANVFVRDRNLDGTTDAEGTLIFDDPENVYTGRVSVSRFGYPTFALEGLESSAQNQAPAISGNGRYVAFATSSESIGGLAFGPTNFDYQDSNGFRDVFVRDLATPTEPSPIDPNQPPQVRIIDPTWLSQRSLSIGSSIYLSALASDPDTDGEIVDVTFYINGEEYPSDQYGTGNYWTAEWTANSGLGPVTVLARATDNKGSATISPALNFTVVEAIPAPIRVEMLPLAIGANPEVGRPTTLRANVILPFITPPISPDDPRPPTTIGGAIVFFYADGSLIGSVQAPASTSNFTVSLDWVPEQIGATQLTALAATFTDIFTFATLKSFNTISVNVGGLPTNPNPPQAFVISSYSDILGRLPTTSEFAFYLDALKQGLSGGTLVSQLLRTREYARVRNRIFDFYYRLGVEPTKSVFDQYNGILLNPDDPAFNNSLLPITNYPPFSSPAPPFGATVGQATVAQLIIESPAFVNAWEPPHPEDGYPLPPEAADYDGDDIKDLPNNEFLRLFLYPRLGGQVGNPFPVEAMMNTFSPPADSQGSAVAFLTAMYANVGLLNGEVAARQIAYQYQLWAVSAQWLNNEEWIKPALDPLTSTPVENQAGLIRFLDVLYPTPTSERAIGYDSWAATAGLTAGELGAEANPSGDGISNLMKYAFNLDPNESYIGPTATLMPKLDASSPLPGGSAGLPYVAVGDDGRMVVQFVRRRNAANVVGYEVQFSSNLSTGWQPADGVPQVQILDATWERVTVRDTANNPKTRFGRVKVTDLTP